MRKLSKVILFSQLGNYFSPVREVISTCMVEITQYALKGQKLLAQGIALGNWDANLPP